MTKMLLIFPNAYNRIKTCLQENPEAEIISKKLLPIIYDNEKSDQQKWIELRQNLLKLSTLRRRGEANKDMNHETKNWKDNSSQTKFIFKNDFSSQTVPEKQEMLNESMKETYFEDENFSDNHERFKTPKAPRKRNRNVLDDTMEPKKKERKHDDMKIIEKDGSVYTILCDDNKKIDDAELREMIKKAEHENKAEETRETRITRSRSKSKKQTGNNIFSWCKIK